ncbi:MAG: YfjI family protein [Psychrobacter sp.]
MTITLQTDSQEKAHGKVSLSGILGDYPIAAIEALSDFTILNQNYSLLNPKSLLVIDDKITVTRGENAGDKLDTVGTIAMVLHNKDYEPVSLLCLYADDHIKPLITDTSQPSGYLIGPLSNDSELIAVDNLDDGIALAKCLINEDVTIAISPNKWLFNDTVKHFSQDRPVTIFTTLDKANEIRKPLAGHNVKVVITSDRTVLEHLEYGGLNYSAILANSETTIANLQADAWDEPESLSNDPSKPTPYPIKAFTGLLRRVIEAVAYYAQVPLAMAGQCVLGALAHMGQRFIDAPIGHGHMPASLILITEGESGSGKTQAMGLTHFKIKEYERQQYASYLDDIAAWESEKAGLKGRELASFLDENPKPYNPKNLFDDATIEPILDRFISGEMNNASWTTDEAGQFFNGHTMTGDTAGSALSAITKLYSDGEVSRLRSQKSAYATPKTDAHGVRMTLLLQGQRVVLEQALTDPLMNGQGFLARALIACPEDLRGQRTWDDEQRRNDSPYDNPHLVEYWSRCQTLLDPLPANLPNDSTGTPHRIKMQWADCAEQIFYKHMQTIENRQAQGQTFEYLKAYASRMAENASRIASLMAFFEGRKIITADDVTRSFMLVEYSTAERLRYLDAAPTGEQNDSEKLSIWLVDKAKGKNPHKLGRTYIANNAPNPMRKNTKLLQNELDKLESAKHIRQEMEGRSKVILINPKLYD